MNYDKIGNFIALKRKEKNLTQKELADKIGVTDKAVSKWERGLGCPDVSILEILADILDVSILEILKGRMVENEVLKITHDNDYIKEIINYSNMNKKEKTKKIINRLIIILTSFIIILLILLNLINIIYLNITREISFDSGRIVGIKDDIIKVENNINLIKNNKGIYTKDEHQKIVEILETFDEIKNEQILKYSGTQKFKIKDIQKLDINFAKRLRILEVYDILEKYDLKVNREKLIHLDLLIYRVYLINYYNEPYFSYQYSIKLPVEYISNIDNNLSVRELEIRYLVDEYLNITEKIKEVGGIYE